MLLGKANPLIKKAMAAVVMLISIKGMKTVTAFSNKDLLKVDRIS